jgi:NADPH:quinone reductase-like Zn-dependent oxidoreductase
LSDVPVVPKTMRAVVLTGHGGLDKLELHADWPVPTPAAGEVLIRVRAAALNNTDINTRTAWYHEDVKSGITTDGGQGGFSDAEGKSANWSGKALAFPRIQGADVCGEIVAVGAGVSEDRVGQRVILDGWLRDPDDPMNGETAGYFGSETDGGFAQYTVIDGALAHAVRSDLSDVELASFPCAYATCENMVSRGEVRAGDQVLITGASGGVGSAAIQLCKRRGATVVALAGESKHDQLRPLGADLLLPRMPDDLEAALTPITGDGKVDVVLDVVGGPGFATVTDRLRHGGRYASAGAIGGPTVEFNLRNLIYRDLQFRGATVLPPSVFADLVGYIERGEVRPVVGKVFKLEDIRAAQELFLTKALVGKIVLEVD